MSYVELSYVQFEFYIITRYSDDMFKQISF